MLEALNMFPESRYFKVKKNAELDHQCGGLSSLFVITVCITLLCIKLVEMFQRKTIFFTTENQNNIIPDMATLSTFQNDTFHNPYMLAVQMPTSICYDIPTPTVYHFSY